jgi:DNA repair exonuclease SbcCD ATPase subunit
MIGGADKIPPTMAALSEAKQLLEMLGDDKTLRRQLEKLKAQTAEYRSALADAEKAIDAANALKAESERALGEIATAKAAVKKERTALEARNEALRERERELKAREDALKPKWEALRREALALQGRASDMAASAIAFAKDLDSET